MQPRTIRSYIEQGLLRGPETGGRGARYSLYHLQRLQAIHALKEMRGFALAEVRRRLLGMTAVEIASLAKEAELASTPAGLPRAGSALDYLRHLRPRGEQEQGSSSPPPEGLTPTDVLLARLDRLAPGANPPRRARGEVWTSVPLTRDVEIRVRGTLTADGLARWERIADHLREILMGEAQGE